MQKIFFNKAGPLTIDHICQSLGVLDVAQPYKMVSGVATLNAATAEELTFFNNAKYKEALLITKAGACLVSAENAEHVPPAVVPIVVKDPYLAYAMVLDLFYPDAAVTPYISPKAEVHPESTIGAGASIGPYAVIEAGAQIGAGCVIGAGVYIGRSVAIGAGSVLKAHSCVEHATIGARCLIHTGARIGQDGFGFTTCPMGLKKIKQVGTVRIGDDVEIGANTCIDRGAIEDTVIGDGCKIDNLVQIGHNCVIGKHTLICGQVGLAGSTKIGNGVMMGGQAGASGHLSIGDGAMVAAQSGVWSDVSSKAVVGGIPSQPIRDWHKGTVMLKQLVKKRNEGKK
jgi:UDP-3-O-[3-hydroxymyristoyl] glucosamine N-acyltransferase